MPKLEDILKDLKNSPNRADWLEVMFRLLWSRVPVLVQRKWWRDSPQVQEIVERLKAEAAGEAETDWEKLITLDSSLSDYVRSEEDSPATNFKILADYACDLECVGATLNGHDANEISFSMTLRQAFEIGWHWECGEPGKPAHYLAGCLNDFDLSDVIDAADLSKAAARIQQLWDQFKESKKCSSSSPAEPTPTSAFGH